MLKITKGYASLQFNQATVTPSSSSMRIYNWAPINLIIPKSAATLLIGTSAAMMSFILL
jgi:hypothetical protein